MKQTVEEAAREHQTHFEICDAEGTISGFINGVHKQSYESFISGAQWQSKQSPWISVKERLPEVGEHVLTKGAYGFLICYFSSLGEWETGANVNKERLGITHYMPIPSFDEILEENRDVLERIKEKGD